MDFTCGIPNMCCEVDSLDHTPPVIATESVYSWKDDNVDKALKILETLMESDKRSFHNQETENDWIFDRIYEAIKLLKGY